MADMTPREQAQAVRAQSRALIATLRANRRMAAAQKPSPRDTLNARAGTVSDRTLKPAVEVDARSTAKIEQAGKSMERRTWDAERLRREATRNRLAVAEEMSRLREARWQSKQASRAVAAAANAMGATGTPSREAVKPTPPAAKPSAAFASTFPGGFAARASRGVEPVAPARRIESGDHGQAKIKMGAELHRRPVAKPDARPPLDIDTISGLGTGFKAKLRRLGLGTVEKLAAQHPEQLRKLLGPAGRLVNIEALIKTARTASGVMPSASRGRRS